MVIANEWSKTLWDVEVNVVKKKFNSKTIIGFCDFVKTKEFKKISQKMKLRSWIGKKFYVFHREYYQV